MKPDHPVIPCAELGLWVDETLQVMMSTLNSRISNVRVCQAQLQLLDQSRSTATAAVMSAMDMLAAAVDTRRKALLSEIDELYNAAALELRATQSQIHTEVQDLLHPLITTEVTAVAADEHDSLCVPRSRDDSPQATHLLPPSQSPPAPNTVQVPGAQPQTPKTSTIIRFSGNSAVHNLSKQIESIGTIRFTPQ